MGSTPTLFSQVCLEFFALLLCMGSQERPFSASQCRLGPSQSVGRVKVCVVQHTPAGLNGDVVNAVEMCQVSMAF